MTNTNSLVVSASNICNRFYLIDPHAVNLDNRDWYDQLSTRLAILIGDTELLYLDHDLDVPGGSGSGSTVVAITENVFIIMTIGEMGGKRTLDAIEIRGRNEVSDVTILDVDNAIGWTRPTYPDSLSVAVSLSGRLIGLPMRPNSRAAATELAPLVSGLVRDLDRR